MKLHLELIQNIGGNAIKAIGGQLVQIIGRTQRATVHIVQDI